MLVSYDFSLVAFHIATIWSFLLWWCMLRGGIWMWMKSNYFGSLKAKLILAPLGIQKWVRPSMDQYRMFFGQTSTRPPSMNRKPIKHGRCWIQINQLPTDTHVELKDKSSYTDRFLSPGQISLVHHFHPNIKFGEHVSVQLPVNSFYCSPPYKTFDFITFCISSRKSLAQKCKN